MTIFGYIRVSSVEQANGTSLDSQEARVRLAGATTIYEDAGVSGATPLAQRPAGGLLIASCKQGDTIVAAKLDRLFRSSRDALNTVEDLKAQGIHVVLADMGNDPVTGNGTAKLFFTMLAAFADFERTRIAERTAEGIANKKANGGALGGLAPFGYQKIGKGKEARLEPLEQEQQAIVRIRVLHQEGKSLRKIVTNIQQEFELTLTPPTVSKILKG
jgi:DNA invertase Pin-like site-specific DNA recombinase